MELQRLQLPKSWEEHEKYARRMRGVVASYMRDDLEYVIDVTELVDEHDHNFEVSLRQVGDGGATFKRKEEHLDTYEECEKQVVKYANQYV